MNHLILAAARFADEAHRGILRKYNNQPYIIHPMRVAGWMSLIPGPQAAEAVAAAWLHDVPEDNPSYWERIEEALPAYVRIVAKQLRNPSKDREDLDRAARKQMDREHLAGCCDTAKIIKMIDRTDNLLDLGLAKRGFQVKYAKESLLLVEALRPTCNDNDFNYWANRVESEANRLLA